MRRIVLPVFVWAFLVALLSSVVFIDVLNAQDNVKQNRGAKLLEKLKQKEESKSLDQLWDEVEESIDNEDYESAIPKLEAILKQEDSEEARAALEVCKKKLGVEPLPGKLSSTAWAPGEKAGDRKVVIVNGVEFAFRWCPAGKFTMGSPTTEEGRDDDETQHEVTLTKGFWMMETEVTLGMFKAFVSDTGYESKGNTPYGWNGSKFEENSKYSWRNLGFIQDDKYPVTNVSWNDAVEFCKWLSKKTGQNITLPMEAQWEYACRAGTTGAYAGDLDAMARYNENGGTHPVGTKKPNAWGLYDMHGNVCEWCADWYGDYPSGSVTDPVGSKNGSNRSISLSAKSGTGFNPYANLKGNGLDGLKCVIRGGDWKDSARRCRSANRDNEKPGCRHGLLGFRILKGQ